MSQRTVSGAKPTTMRQGCATSRPWRAVARRRVPRRQAARGPAAPLFRRARSSHAIVPLHAPCQRRARVLGHRPQPPPRLQPTSRTLRRSVAFGELEPPPPPYDDPRAEVLRQRRLEHEQRLLEQLATDGRTVETIIPPDTPFWNRNPMAAAARTLDAMRRRTDVSYQGCLLEDESTGGPSHPRARHAGRARQGARGAARAVGRRRVLRPRRGHLRGRRRARIAAIVSDGGAGPCAGSVRSRLFMRSPAWPCGAAP